MNDINLILINSKVLALYFDEDNVLRGVKQKYGSNRFAEKATRIIFVTPHHPPMPDSFHLDCHPFQSRQRNVIYTQ